MSDALAAVAEPRRRQLLALLGEGEAAVGDLAAHFDVTRPAISQHLRVLLDARLVTERREGRRRLYSLDPAGFIELRSALEEFWDLELADLAHAAEARADSRRADSHGAGKATLEESDPSTPTSQT
jgi:DNA-binding transcriptional ArsR family regulator